MKRPNPTTLALDDLGKALRDRHGDDLCNDMLVIRSCTEHDSTLEKLGKDRRPPSCVKVSTPEAWLKHPPLERRYPVGVVWDFPFDLPDTSAEQLLARLRDLDCEAVYVRCGASGDAPESEEPWHKRLHALGFVPLKKHSDQISLFYFGVYDYKRVPDWLNSKFWANPHMWNKARW